MNWRIAMQDYNCDWALHDVAATPKSTAGYLSREEAVGLLGTLQLDGIELMHDYWIDYPTEKLKDLTQNAGLPIVAYIFFVDLAVPERERPSKIEEVHVLLDRTALLGAPFAMIVPGVVKKGPALGEQRQWIVDGLRQCTDHAASLGVTMVAENIDYPPTSPLMGNPVDCCDICEAIDSPAFRLIFDPGAALFVGEDPLSTLNLMAPHISHVHIKNIRAVRPDEPRERFFTAEDGTRYTGTDLETGLIKISPIFSKLNEIDYNGYLSIEYQGEEDPRIALPRNLKYFRDVLLNND